MVGGKQHPIDRGIYVWHRLVTTAPALAFTRYCHCQYCVVYIIITGGSGGNIILRNSVGDDRGIGCLNKGWVRRE